jgi:hypothetical protein
VAEAHEGKSLESTAFVVGDDFDPFNRSISGEEAGRSVTNIKFAI